MVWYSHLFQNFPQFLVMHTIKGFGIVNKAEVPRSQAHALLPDISLTPTVLCAHTCPLGSLGSQAALALACLEMWALA